ARRGNIYFAELRLLRDGVPTIIDVRPSDAMLVALRSGAPFLFAEPLLVPDSVSEPEPAEPDVAAPRSRCRNRCPATMVPGVLRCQELPTAACGAGNGSVRRLREKLTVESAAKPRFCRTGGAGNSASLRDGERRFMVD